MLYEGNKFNNNILLTKYLYIEENHIQSMHLYNMEYMNKLKIRHTCSSRRFNSSLLVSASWDFRTWPNKHKFIALSRLYFFGRFGLKKKYKKTTQDCWIIDQSAIAFKLTKPNGFQPVGSSSKSRIPTFPRRSRSSFCFDGFISEVNSRRILGVKT